jgi:uncharacterized LabA/DUF88 family protein
MTCGNESDERHGPMSDAAAVPGRSNIVLATSHVSTETGTDLRGLRATPQRLPTALAFVDLENLFEGYHNAFEHLPSFDPARLIQEFCAVLQDSGVSAVGLRVRAYADFDSSLGGITLLRAWRSRAESLGVECVQPAVERYQPNIVDRMIAMDAIRDCHELPQVATFILVSGDSGFTCLAQRLRERGKRIIQCFGREQPASVLMGTCHVHRSVEAPAPRGQLASEAIVRYWLAGTAPDIRVPGSLALSKVVKFLIGAERVPCRLSEWAKRFTECEPSLGFRDAEGLARTLEFAGLLVPAVDVEDGATGLVRAVDLCDCDQALIRLSEYLEGRLKPLIRWPRPTLGSEQTGYQERVERRVTLIQDGISAAVFGRSPSPGE